MTQSKYDRIAFVASPSPEAQEALAALTKAHGNHAEQNLAEFPEHGLIVHLARKPGPRVGSSWY